MRRDGSGVGGKHADGPDSIRVAIHCGFGVHTAALPDPNGAVLTAREYPAVALSTAACREGESSRACGKASYYAIMATVRAIALNV